MKLKHRLILLLSFLTIIFCFSSCIMGEEEKKTENYKKEQSEREDKAKKYYPVEIVDSMDRKVTILSEPKRIISLAPNMSEIICAIERENLLVGRTALCNYPEIIAKIDSVGDFYQPDIDKIVALEPDLIVISSLTKQVTMDALDENSLNYIVLNEDKSLSGTYTMIEKLGMALNAVEESDELIKEMKEEIAFIRHKVKKADKPRVYFMYDLEYSPGNNTFIDDIITSSGAINANGKNEGWVLVSDNIKELDPDIIVAPKRLFNDIRTLDMFQELSAVKKNKFFEIDEDIISRQGPRVVDAVDIMARILHPELFKD